MPRFCWCPALLGLSVACLYLGGQEPVAAAATPRCRALVFGDPGTNSPPSQMAIMEQAITGVAAALGERGFEVELLPSARLTHRDVAERLDDYEDTLTEADTFVVYAHCHGDPLGTYFSSWRRFADRILALRARRVVVFAMACRAGTLTDVLHKRREEWEGRAAAGRSLVVLTPVDASQNAGPSPEPGIGNPFAHAVITALQGAADGCGGHARNGRVELQELVDHVLAVTRLKSRDQDHRPQFAGTFPQDAAFVDLAPAPGIAPQGPPATAAAEPVLAPVTVPTAAALRAVTAWTIDSRVLDERRRVFVALPSGYDADQAARYPVLYVLDGGIDEDFVHVAEAVHFGCTWDLLQPMLVVGIENTDRRRDLTTPTEVEAERAAAPHAGGAERFREFLRAELMPAVRAHFRTDGRDALAGESLAGLFVVTTFVEAPELFDDYIAFSPSLWWNDRAAGKRARDRLPALATAQAKLYLATADEADIVGAVEEFVGILRQQPPAGVALEYHPMPAEFHDTVFRAAAPRALRQLFGRAK